MTNPSANPTPNPLERHSYWLAILIGILLMAIIGFFDWYTDPEMNFGLYYLIPIALVTWFSGSRAGFIMGAACAVTTFVATVYSEYEPMRPAAVAFNCLAATAFFLAISALLARLKSFGERLEALVQQRTAALQEEITEHQQARRAIHDLTARLSAAEDSERRRLAYDIHDSLSQNLSLLKLNLQAAASRIGDAARPDGPLADTVKMVDDMIDQTRTLTFDLHPAMLDDLGLAPTLNWFAEQFHRRTQVEVTVSEVGDRRGLPQALANHLFRSVKELINNAAKHGKAKEVVVAIHWRPDRLRIVVDDDGAGFDSARALALQSRRGLGLAGIQERLASLNGDIRIESAVGQGTRVILEVALTDYSNQSVHHDNPNPVG